MIWLLRADDTGGPADRTVGDTALGNKSTDTKEDVFTQEHNRAVADALRVEQQREKFVQSQRSRIEKYQPIRERSEAMRAAREERKNRDEQRRRERSDAARERQDKREEEQSGRSSSTNGTHGGVKSARDTAKEGGQEKSYQARSKANYFITRIKSLIGQQYSALEAQIKSDSKTIRANEDRLRQIKGEKSKLRIDIGKARDTYRQQLRVDAVSAKREFDRTKKDALANEQKLKLEESRIKRAQQELKVSLQKRDNNLKELKKLVDKVERARLDRNDPIGELDKLHTELSKYKINLPNLRLAA